MGITGQQLELLRHVADITKNAGTCALGSEYAGTAVKCLNDGYLTLSPDGSNATLTDKGKKEVDSAQ
jgi:hypothetical protein